MCIDSLILKAQAKQRQLWLLAAVLFIVPFSLYVMLCFFVGSDMLGMQGRSVGAMLSGTAIKPHVYRQLVPMLANLAVALSPEALQAAVTGTMQGWLADGGSMFSTLVRFRHPVKPPLEVTEHLYQIFVVMVIDYAFLMGYVYYVWALAKRLFPSLFSAQVIAPCLAIIAVAPLCAKFAYIYDFPVLFFSAWLSYALVRKKLVLFTLGVAIATLNKETSFYFLGLFMLYGWRELPRAAWAAYLLCQCVLFILVKTGVTLYFQHNVGDFLWTRGFYDHVITNMDGYPAYNFMGAVVAIAVLGFRFHAQPRVLQCWLPMLPVCILTGLVFGMRREYRVLYEIFPALLLLASHNLAYLLQKRDEGETTPEGF